MKRKDRMAKSERLIRHGELNLAISALHDESVDAARWFIGGNSTPEELVRVLQREIDAFEERRNL